MCAGTGVSHTEQKYGSTYLSQSSQTFASDELLQIASRWVLVRLINQKMKVIASLMIVCLCLLAFVFLLVCAQIKKKDDNQF